MQFLDNAGQVAASISAILALLGLIFFTPVKNRLKKRKRAKAEAAAEQKAFRAELRQSLEKITTARGGLSDDIGDLQYERLSQAQDFYASRGWCPGAKKEMLCKMHASYRARGRNHLSEHYEEEILRLPDKPPERKGQKYENQLAGQD